ncbi:MAG: hypothetical protein JXB13_06120 [Phycisphaerae bacterium]|nr:hypothetical protein [Phycisphaerae bacterium]
MYRKTSRVIGLMLCVTILVGGSAAWLSGCSVSVGPAAGGGGLAVSFSIGGKSFMFTLGTAGYFPLQPNAVVRNVADVQPFAQAPSDTPATGAVRLRGSSITILPPGGSAKSMEAAQAAISGTARLRVAIDAPGALSPCDSGVDLGEFEIVVANGVVTSVGPGLALHLAAVDYFNRNDLAMCLEMTADFEAGLQIEGIDVTFGPSQSGAGDGLRATFDRRNLESPPIHLLAPGEDFGAENQIGIGVPRTLLIDDLSINGLVTFRAGRDGQVLDSVTCPPVRYSGYYAIVEWDGTDLRCYEPVFTPEPKEACCLPPLQGYELYDETYAEALMCQTLGSRRTFSTREDCRFFGGVPQGEGTTCATVTCDEPFYACCIGDMCSEMLFEDCRKYGGTYQGTGSHCEFLTCGSGSDGDEPQPPPAMSEEACCFDTGECVDGDPEICSLTGGTPQGAGTVCATTDCPQPRGACCDKNEKCNEMTEQQCIDSRGAFLGAGTDCATADCDLGACCWGDGQCTDTTVDLCEELTNSRFLGGSSSCDTNPCAEGACCWSGGCTLTSSADCADLDGTYQGDGTSCEPDPCVEYVVWYTGNVCCWGAPRLYISTRTEFNQSASTCNFPGGGIDCSVPLVRVELKGGFKDYAAAQAWLCPQFESRIYHYWCGAHYQMDGKNWSTAPCDNLGDLPELEESQRIDSNLCQ